MEVDYPKARARKKYRTVTQNNEREGGTDEREKFNVVEKRACSCLFQLSDNVEYGFANPEKGNRTIIQNCNLYSPWKSKPKQEGLYLPKGKIGKRQRLSELQQIKRVSFFPRRKTSHQKKTTQDIRHHTQPKQKILSMPKLLKTETIVLDNDNKTNQESCFSENKTYSSQQVLHITRALRDSSQKMNIQVPSQCKAKIVANYSTLEWKFNLNKENRNSVKMNRIGENVGNRVRNIKCVKKKRLKKMFADTLAAKNHPHSHLKQGSLSQKINIANQSNPISRTLLEKYLQVCDEISRQSIILP